MSPCSSAYIIYVGHSWKDYIYSPSMRYTVLPPFAISKISTVLSVLDVLRFWPILNPLTFAYGSQLCVTIHLLINVWVSHSKLYTTPVYIDESIFSTLSHIELFINLIFILDFPVDFDCLANLIFLLSNIGSLISFKLSSMETFILYD